MYLALKSLLIIASIVNNHVIKIGINRCKTHFSFMVEASKRVHHVLKYMHCNIHTLT